MIECTIAPIALALNIIQFLLNNEKWTKYANRKNEKTYSVWKAAAPISFVRSGFHFILSFFSL